ncbi:2-hydroxyacyl-CoA dehydratase family protein [Microbacterium elymi]|uniref:2-hydroxyacyl-CoA dehydratase family protein n=1 Tax=Microbacterium elymi TaxID=2909587 RepID=A0ABY5NHP6_9MICO|nr:2-hydroxyacyl-CoA dehydratase family protein [Microbacterium elymi]UUT34708.1 2-hydroxyacyl-CoA dehydratase family protein [Microbacterium elymi]
MQQLEALTAFCTRLSGSSSTPESLRASAAGEADVAAALGRLRARRRAPSPVAGTSALAAMIAATSQTATDAVAALDAVVETAPPGALRAHLTGSAHPDASVYARLEEHGIVVVSDDHQTGDETRLGACVDSGDLDEVHAGLVDHHFARTAGSAGASIAARAAITRVGAQGSGAQAVVSLIREGDEAPAWDLAAIREELAGVGIPVLLRRWIPRGGSSTAAIEVAAELARRTGGVMSGERLASAVAATAHQRAWFQEVRARAADGEPIAFVNADAPHEIFRALGIPYVVNQWWASVIAAKRTGPASLARLAARGLPDDSRQYDALALGAQDLDEADAPWGGLPEPAFAVSERSGDVSHKIFELWGRRARTETFLLNRTAAVPAPEGWWDLVPDRWEEAFGTARIDLLEAEIRDLIGMLEGRTSRTLQTEALADIMARANEQAEWNRRTRALIASARPTPIAVTDSIPSVMVPQWHRGSQWAVDAARALHDEVAQRIADGVAVEPRERRRLMWIGRGLWSDLEMYRSFQEEFGAVFVWSMYLAIAADGYLRHGDDPVRTLAARFVGLTDLLYVPPMSSSWYVKEALAHGVDGVVHLVADDTPGAAFISAALEERGIPVLEIVANNADSRSTGRARVQERIAEFLRSRVPVRR